MGIEAANWRPASNATFHGGPHRDYVIGRGNSMESETKGPHFTTWESCVVGAALANGHVTEEAIRGYAGGYAEVDPEALTVMLDQIERLAGVMRQFGWKIPEIEAPTEAPGPGR